MRALQKVQAMKSVDDHRAIVLNMDTIEFVADALEFFVTYEGCERPVQARARELSRFFRTFLPKKPRKPRKARAPRKGAR
jgi:hypothetical protein